MTNYIFPDFQGWSWDKTKTPVWKTTINEADSGLETRIQKWSYPKYKIELKFNFLTDNSIKGFLDKGDLETLQSFYNSVGGSYEDFLFFDDVENSVTNRAFGIGDDLTKEFQLVRNIKNWIEPVKGIVEAPTIYINGVETTDFSFDSSGLIVFNFVPAKGSVLTWSGEYYFRCRFQEDEIELNRTWDGFWEDITVKMVTVK